MTTRRYVSLIIILGLLTALGPFSIDMYLPGFQDIATNLHTSVATVALSLSSFFIGISVGQLLYGPLLDRHGRKKPLYAGLLVYILSSAACLEVTHINSLIALRFVQAVGSCAATVAAMAMVRDLFGAKESAKVFSLLLLVVGASPMIAPTVGGYVISLYGWRAVFVILLGLGILVTLITVIGLPESYQPDESFSLRPRPILKNFYSVLRDRQFITYALTGSFGFAGLFAYVSGSPYIFMDIFHVDKKTYGWIFAGLSVGFIVISQFNTLLLRKFSSKQIIWISLGGQVLISLIFLGGNMAGWYGLPSTLVFIFLFLVCVGFTYPNAAALCLAPFSKNAGSASALMGALQMGVGALASVGISLFSNGTSNPMIAIMAATSILGLGILFAGKGVVLVTGEMGVVQLH
jgi:DHA1 family bicyclomycin/chloramphenicol resistance-like MFS transporter